MPPIDTIRQRKAVGDKPGFHLYRETTGDLAAKNGKPADLKLRLEGVEAMVTINGGVVGLVVTLPEDVVRALGMPTKPSAPKIKYLTQATDVKRLIGRTQLAFCTMKNDVWESNSTGREAIVQDRFREGGTEWVMLLHPDSGRRTKILMTELDSRYTATKLVDAPKSVRFHNTF